MKYTYRRRTGHRKHTLRRNWPDRRSVAPSGNRQARVSRQERQLFSNEQPDENSFMVLTRFASFAELPSPKAWFDSWRSVVWIGL